MAYTPPDISVTILQDGYTTPLLSVPITITSGSTTHYSPPGLITTILLDGYVKPSLMEVVVLSPGEEPPENNDYVPPPGNIVKLSFKPEQYIPPVGNKVPLSFGTLPPVDDCIPTWEDQPGDQLKISFKNSWKRLPSTDPLKITFTCQGNEPVECDPDWVVVPGDDIVIDFVSCEGDPDWEETPGDHVAIDFDCCEEEPQAPPVTVLGFLFLDEITVQSEVIHTQVVEVNGSNVLLGQVNLTGNVLVDQAQHNVWGDITLGPVVAAGDVRRGTNILPSNAVLGPVTAYGVAELVPPPVTINGNLQLGPIIAAGNVSHYQYRYVTGDILLDDIELDGEALLDILIEGDIQLDDVTLEGEANSIIPTVQDSNLILDDVLLEGHVTYNEVPTAIGDISLGNITVQGFVNYIELPSVWGDIVLDITMEQTAPVEVGILVYWTMIRLSMEMEGFAFHPYYVSGDISIGEIGTSSEIMVVPVVSSDIQIGPFRFNRGYAEFGDPEAPTLREIYEFSNLRESVVKEYPQDAKYPIYVPTTDYNVREVELRRGTLDYTLEFNFDAILVRRIKVWIVDENGNSVQDSIARYLNGPTVPHEFNKPFKWTYQIGLPVHCVNDKKYEFYLEVEYEDTDKANQSMFGTKKFLVPFQAHFDNRNPYGNMTDRTNVYTPSWKINNDQVMSVTTTSFDPTTFIFDDENANTHASSAREMHVTPSFVELGVYNLELRQENAYHVGPHLSSMETEYIELDIGQIGGG